MDAIIDDQETSSPLNLSRTKSFKRKLEESFEESKLSGSSAAKATKKIKLQLRHTKFSHLGDHVSDITSNRIVDGVLISGNFLQFTDYY